ncbi:unnamed protein product, partial [Staurois parvus]
MSLFVIFKFPAVPSPYVPTSQRTEPRRHAGIRWRTLQGTLQEGHRGSAGQGKRRRDPGAAPHGKPSVARGYRFCYTREYRQGGY